MLLVLYMCFIVLNQYNLSYVENEKALDKTTRTARVREKHDLFCRKECDTRTSQFTLLPRQFPPR